MTPSPVVKPTDSGELRPPPPPAYAQHSPLIMSKHRAHLSLLFCIGISTFNEACSQGLLGTYEVAVGVPGNNTTMRLECKAEATCSFSITTQQGTGTPGRETQTLDEVRVAQNLAQANNALKYASEQLTQPITDEEYSDLMSRLRPVLSKSPVAEKCWDLNYIAPTYLLLCTLSNTSSSDAPLYLFATLMAGCGQAFCRYVIYPLNRSK